MFPTGAEGTAPFGVKALDPPLSMIRSGPPRGSPEPAPRDKLPPGHGARPVFSRLERSGEVGGAGHGGVHELHCHTVNTQAGP